MLAVLLDTDFTLIVALETVGFVTAVARGFLVLTVEREVGLFVMVEDDFIPAFTVMAAVTFLTEFTTVYVLNLMTADTGLRCVLVLLIQVAGITAYFLVAELQWEIGLVMIKFGFLPASRIVTIATLFSLFAIMDIDLLMAAVTISGCFAVFLVWQVTGITAGLGMGAF